MVLRNLLIFYFSVLSVFVPSCTRCITGGQLHIKENYISNACGLINGVYIKEIQVDSIVNNIPTKFITILSATLYRQGASPNNVPTRLYFDKDCKEVYLWSNEKIIDTIQSSFTFKEEAWYSFHSMDSHQEIFMLVDKSGKRHFYEVSEKSGLTNF